MAGSNGDAVELSRWEYAVSARGEAYLVQEIRKARMSLQAVAKLERAMKRLEDGQARAFEHERLRNDIHELRVNIDKRWYRVFYAVEGQLFVALGLLVKKQNKVDKRSIDTAERRLKEHRSRR